MVRAHLVNPMDSTDELTIMEWTEGRLTKGRYKIIYGEMLDWADENKRCHLQMAVKVDDSRLLFDMIRIPRTGNALLFVTRLDDEFCSYGIELLKVFDIAKRYPY